MFNKTENNGFGIIEIIVGTAIISLSFLALMSVASISLRIMDMNANSLKASFLLEEGTEAVKILRDGDWGGNIAPLATSTDYYFEFDGTDWKATSTNIFIDDFFERKFVAEDVYRDANDDISSAGTLDSGTKKITVFVSWFGRTSTTSKSIATYIADIF